MNGFGEQTGRKRHKDWADKSLQKTTKELKMLREVIEKYKDDPDGRHTVSYTHLTLPTIYSV